MCRHCRPYIVPYIDTNNPQGMQLGRFKNRTFPLCHSNQDMYPFLKDATFFPCFCFVHTIAQLYCFGTFLTLWLKLMQWYITSVIRGSLYENFGNKCVKILKIWRTELSYAQKKNRGKKMRLLGMDTCPSLNDIMEIRCNKCTRSEQGYDF